VGVLVGMGNPEDEARLCQERLKKGGCSFPSTRKHATRQTARNIFQQIGATDIVATHEVKREPVETKGIPRGGWPVAERLAGIVRSLSSLSAMKRK
jgi:hypothetical protein